MEQYMQTPAHGIVRMQTDICDKQLTTELSTDLTLPDYLPEIKRLLRVRACVVPPDKYIGAGNAEFSGRIDYSILYTGNDGALYTATESGEYQFSTPLESTADFELNEGLTCHVECIPEGTVGRVAAPRRLSLKCRLRSRVRIWGIKLAEEQVACPDTSQLQRLLGQTEAARRFLGMSEPITLGDEILTDQDSADLRIISAEATVFVSEAEARSGAVNCRGEVCLKLLCCHENAPLPPLSLQRRIPFSHMVTVDGVEVNCDACVDGVATDLQISVEDGRILCEVVILLRAMAQRNETIAYTRDLYSTASLSETHTVHCRLPRAERCINGNFSLNTTLPLEEAGLRAGLTPIDLTLTPTVTALECEGGKTVLCGHCRVSALLFDGEDVSVQEFELPFRYLADGGSNVTDYDATVEPISCRARTDSERIAIDAELAVCLSTRSEVSFDMLNEARMGDPLHTSNAMLTVCYPAREDTLWSVAKRYHRPISEIAERNSLAGAPAADSPDSLTGISYLVI